MKEVDIRCPVNPRRLFMKLMLSGESPTVNADNLIELACLECKKSLRDQVDRPISRVLHTYAFDGEFVKTIIQTH